jgi:fructose-specific component phosphotransferase system IIB-like protein
MRYRIYAIGAGGEIVSGADLSATNDSAALYEAAEHPNLHGIEIWQGNRRVAVVSPPSARALRCAMGTGWPYQVPVSSTAGFSDSRLPRSSEARPTDFSERSYSKPRDVVAPVKI